MRGRGEGSIYKDRRGRWVTAIPLGYNPKNGHRQRKIFISATYKDALKKLKSYKREKGLQSSEIKTLGAWLDVYVDTFRVNCEESTRRAYRYAARRIKNEGDALKLCDVTRPRIQQIINAIAKKYSASTASQAAGFLMAALNEAEDEGLIKHVGRIESPRRRESRKVPLPSSGEWSRLLNCAKRYGYGQGVALVIIATLTGMRRGELAAMRWSDVDFSGGCINVTRAARGNLKNLEYGDTKTHKSRFIPIGADLASALRAWRARQKIIFMRCGWGAPRNNVFYTEGGGAVSPVSLSAMFKRAARAAGLSLTLHSMRHIYATNLIRAGVDVKAAQTALGHASASTTLNIYATAGDDWENEIKNAALSSALQSALHDVKF